MLSTQSLIMVIKIVETCKGGFKGGEGTMPPPNFAPTSTRRGHMAPLECKKEHFGWLPLPKNSIPLSALWASRFDPSGLTLGCSQDDRQDPPMETW